MSDQPTIDSLWAALEEQAARIDALERKVAERGVKPAFTIRGQPVYAADKSVIGPYDGVVVDTSAWNAADDCEPQAAKATEQPRTPRLGSRVEARTELGVRIAMLVAWSVDGRAIVDNGGLLYAENVVECPWGGDQ